jgi:hypothetical protein
MCLCFHFNEQKAQAREEIKQYVALTLVHRLLLVIVTDAQVYFTHT